MLVALVGVAVALGEPIAHVYWNLTAKVFQAPAPRGIVLVTIDRDETWTSQRQAQVLEAIRQGSPGRVYLDWNFRLGSDPQGDAALQRALRSFGDRMRFVSRSPYSDRLDGAQFPLPPAALVGEGQVVLSGWNSNALYYAESSPYVIEGEGKIYSSLAADLARVHSGLEPVFYPDFAIDFNSVAKVGTRSVLDSRSSPDAWRGRDVIITDLDRGPPIYAFGHQAVPAVMVDLAGVAGLRRPVSFAFGNALFLGPLLLLTVITGLLWLTRRNEDPAKRKLGYWCAIALSVVLPFVLRQIGVVASPDAAWVMLVTFGLIRLWQKRTRRIQQTSASGLPNLIAFSATEIPVGRDIVVAAIARYEEMIASLPQSLHGELARQIARRISIGSGSDGIYHSDGCHFAWTEEVRPLDVQLSHLEGLRALFAAPLLIEGHTFDTNIHFGLDRNEQLDPLTRVNSALASANEAVSNCRTVELFDASRLREASWDLSIHARIDEGLRNGDIRLAYQSKWDIASNRICGAEALIRWDHPTRGPIAPDAFILQAERAGRIDALTYWVLEEAITVALAMNAIGPRFQMSINLSAQMVDKPELVSSFGEIVHRRGIDPGLLTIEITETSSVRNRPAACHNLTHLRELGFRLSIDDFGTGEASLAYLSDLPSDELKLDRRFISRLLGSERDLAIVRNTIRLAHDLGQTIVAEGIEDGATYALLREIGCDEGQGYHLGRPQPFDQFEQTYKEHLLRQTGVI